MSSLFNDLVLAHRYAYYVKGESLISDMEYDALEKESSIDFVGSDLEKDYPASVRALYLYLKLSAAPKNYE